MSEITTGLLASDQPLDLTTLSQGGNTPESLQAWLASLPVLKTGENARQFLVLLPELNRLSVSEEKRLAMLEQLRPALHTVLTGLGRHHQHQGVKLDEQARRIADMVMVLRSALASLYYTVARRLIISHVERQDTKRDLLGVMRSWLNRPTAANASPNVILSLSRAFDELGTVQLEALLNYQPVPEGIWLRLNDLYAIAEQYELLDLNFVHDKKATPIRYHYLRNVLVALANPNQLRPAELSELWQQSLLLASTIRVQGPDDPTSRFYLDLAADAPPQPMPAQPDQPTQRSLQLDQLLEQLGASHPPVLLSASLQTRLRQTLSNTAQRAYPRQAHTAQTGVVLGLAAIHHQLGGGRRMDQIIGVPHDVPVKSSLSIADHIEYDAASDQLKQEALREQAKPILAIIRDRSPLGYRLFWPTNPALLRSGELVGLQTGEAGQWQVGVIRWLRQVRQPDLQGVETGIELLSSQCRACGIRVLEREGKQTDFHRALLLPNPLSSDEHSATLLTPPSLFNPNQRLSLRMRNHEMYIELRAVLTMTASYKQFSFSLTQTPMRHRLGPNEDTGLI